MTEPTSRLKPELIAVEKEHLYSEQKWEELDKHNNLNYYIAWAVTYLGTAAQIVTDNEARYAALIKAANLMLTAAMRLRTDTLPPRAMDEGRVMEDCEMRSKRGIRLK